MSLPAIDQCLRCGGQTERRRRGWYCPYCALDFETPEPGILIFGGADSWIMESAEERQCIRDNSAKLRAKHLNAKGPDC